LLTLGFRSHTDIPALKELEEWFDAQKEMRGRAKLDPFFERTSKLASRQLKREIERRGTLGEFALEPDAPHLKRILPEESVMGPNATALSGQVESPLCIVKWFSVKLSHRKTSKRTSCEVDWLATRRGAVILSRLTRQESQLKSDHSFPTEGAGIGRIVAEQILK
jgi:hypothetical protein